MTSAVVFAWLGAAPVLCAPAPAPAAPAAAPTPAPIPAKHPLPGVDVELKTEDGWTIKGKYLEAGPGQRTVLLLPGRGRTKEEYHALTGELQKQGDGYLAIDLRGHGESNVGPDGQTRSFRQFKATRAENDFEDMRLDVKAAFDYLAGQKVETPAPGLVGDDLGGAVGLKYAAVHPEVGAVVWLSPATDYSGVQSVAAMRAYKNRPILLIYPDADKRSARETPILYNFARASAGEQNAFMVGVPRVPGIKLSSSPGVVTQIAGWLVNPSGAGASASSTAPAAAESVPPVIPGGEPTPQ